MGDHGGMKLDRASAELYEQVRAAIDAKWVGPTTVRLPVLNQPRQRPRCGRSGAAGVFRLGLLQRLKQSFRD
jgi:hypothetical protein